MSLLIIGVTAGLLAWLYRLLWPHPVETDAIARPDEDAERTSTVFGFQVPVYANIVGFTLVAVVFAGAAILMQRSKFPDSYAAYYPLNGRDLQKQIDLLEEERQRLHQTLVPPIDVAAKDQELQRQIDLLKKQKEIQEAQRTAPLLPSHVVGSGYALGLLYFVVMLAGMSAEYMFGLKDFKKFTLAEFVRPFWAALIVFSIPWSVVDKNTLTFASVLACYQNGFFWKKVLERRRRN